MKEDFIIHLGLQKTGSTFLQREVFPLIRKTIWSDENLSGDILSKIGSIERYGILEHLYNTVPDAKIIIVLRCEEEWLNSVYSHYIKRGGYKTYDKWFSEEFDKKLLLFDNYVDKIKEYFNEVLVCRYENLVYDCDKFIIDICQFIGVDMPDYRNKFYNRRYNSVYLNLHRYYNFVGNGILRKIYGW